MAENDLDFVLDGNAAAGALREVFAADVTTAHIQCDACGSVGAVGSLRYYAAPMGVVLRCSQLCGHRPSGGPHAAWPLAGNDGRALPQSCSGLRGERGRKRRSTKARCIASTRLTSKVPDPRRVSDQRLGLCVPAAVPRPLWKDRPTCYLVAEQDRMIVLEKYLHGRAHAGPDALPCRRSRADCDRVGRLDMLREEISAVQTEKARNLIRRRPVSRTTR